MEPMRWGMVLLVVAGCGAGEEPVPPFAPVPRGPPECALPAASEPPGTWTDVTAMVGLPPVKAVSASARDVDGDGLPEILITSDPWAQRIDPSTGEATPLGGVELYQGCAGTGYVPLGLAGRVTGEDLLNDVTAATIADLDGDGRRDLLLGGPSRVQVLTSTGDHRFSARTLSFEGNVYGAVPVLEDSVVSSLAVWDLNRDGYQDLFVAMRRRDQELLLDSPKSSDVLLLGGPDGLSDASAAYQPLLTCGTGLTFGVSSIRRQPLGSPNLLYVGVDWGPDCLFAFDDDGGSVHVTQLSLPPISPGDPSLTATMGVDHAYVGDDGGVIIAVSDIGRLPVFYVPPEGPVEDLTPRVGYGERIRVAWGLALHDADLDGQVDMTAAFGTTARAPLGAVESLVGDQMVFQLGSLRHYAGSVGPDGLPRFDDVGPAAGPAFTPGDLGTDDIEPVLEELSDPEEVEALRRDYYGLVALDLDRDGCSDLLTTPRLQVEEREDALPTYRYASPNTVTLLRGHCEPAHGWLGLVLPDAPGALVRVTAVVDEKRITRVDQVKVAPGVAAIGEVERLRFGFGTATVELETLRVDWPDGQVTALPLTGTSLNAWYRVAR